MSKLHSTSNSILSNHSILQNNIFPQSQQFSNFLTEFYTKQSQGNKFYYQKDFQNVVSQVSRTIKNFKGKSQQCQTNLHQIQNQWQKVKKFANTGKGYLNAKNEQIKSKVKNIDAVSTGIKQAVSKIKPQKLAQLPVQKNKSLQNLFKTLFFVLYHEKQSSFDWKNFRKLALLHESGQDFLFRLVSINFKQMKAQESEKLLILKNDPQFQNASVNSQFAYDLIDMADWIQYVCVGHQFSVQKIAAQKQYQKIRKDMGKRSGGSLQLSKKFWKEAFQELNSYQSNLESLQAQLKSFKIGAQNSLENVKQGNQWRHQKISKLNNLLN